MFSVACDMDCLVKWSIFVCSEFLMVIWIICLAVDDRDKSRVSQPLIGSTIQKAGLAEAWFVYRFDNFIQVLHLHIFHVRSNEHYEI